MSLLEEVGLSCAAGFAGDASGPGCGACLPQPESRAASKRQQGVIERLVRVICIVMGTKDYEKDSGQYHATESSNQATAVITRVI